MPPVRPAPGDICPSVTPFATPLKETQCPKTLIRRLPPVTTAELRPKNYKIQKALRATASQYEGDATDMRPKGPRQQLQQLGLEECCKLLYWVHMGKLRIAKAFYVISEGELFLRCQDVFSCRVILGCFTLAVKTCKELPSSSSPVSKHWRKIGSKEGIPHRVTAEEMQGGTASLPQPKTLWSSLLPHLWAVENTPYLKHGHTTMWKSYKKRYKTVLCVKTDRLRRQQLLKNSINLPHAKK